MPTVGRHLILTSLLNLLFGVVVADLAPIALNQRADFKSAFRFTGIAAVMTYCLGFVGNTIWYGQPLKPFLNDLAAGIVFGLLSGAVFGFLRPALDTPAIPAIGG